MLPSILIVRFARIALSTTQHNKWQLICDLNYIAIQSRDDQDCSKLVSVEIAIAITTHKGFIPYVSGLILPCICSAALSICIKRTRSAFNAPSPGGASAATTSV